MHVKRIGAVLLAGLFMGAGVVVAEDEMKLPEGHPPVGQSMMGKGMMGMGKGMMHGMMMKSAMPEPVGVGADGSVYILTGTKLLKYDTDLNLVKEQQIEVDISGMKKMMDACPGCPMCPMKGGGAAGETEADEE